MHKNRSSETMHSKENKLSKIDKTILDNFYKLVHTDQNIRLRASLSTYKILTAMKKNKPSAFNEHLNYCIERLVTGLASSRALARRGFATLLLEILKHHQVSTERLLSIAQQKFGNISNETTADNLMGYFLLVVICIDSGNYKRSKQNAASLDKMYKYLQQLVRIKSYFDYPVSQFLTENYEIFHSQLAANISPELFGSGTKISYTDLLTLVLCNKKQLMREFTTLDSAAILNLTASLNHDRLLKKPLHPIWREYSKLLLTHIPQHFELFYTRTLVPTFFKANHNELAAMGLELVASLLDSTCDPSHIKVILSDYIVRLLIISQRSRSSLQAQCAKFFDKISNSFEGSSKSDLANEDIVRRQISILNRLTSNPGSVAFDEDSKSASIKKLLNSCQPDALKKYLDKLIAILCGNFQPKEAKRLHIACARQISHILHRPRMGDELETVQKLVKFLIANAILTHIDLSNCELDATKQNIWSKNQVSVARHLDSSARDSLKSAYHSAMAFLTSRCTNLQRIESYGQIVDFSNSLLSSNCAELHQDDAEVNSNLWSDYYESLQEHRRLIKKNQNPKILYPITNLFLFYGLQILEHSLDCRGQLKELAQSSLDALKNDPNDGSWADVLTDQIIAILSATECNPWIKRLCVSVFGSLVPHISEVSVDLLKDALTAPLDGESDDDEDEDEISDNDDSYNLAERQDDVRENDSEDDDGDEDDAVHQDDEEDIDDEEGLDEESDQESNGEEADILMDTTGESIGINDEEYLNDDQMIRLDSVIGDMFKVKRQEKEKKSSKDKKQSSFRARVQELLDKVKRV